LSAPFDDGFWFDDDQDLPPILPDLRENRPEESISPMPLRPVNFPVEDGKLLTQREILCRLKFVGHFWIRQQYQLPDRTQILRIIGT
jgi:hypothetical protein